VPGGLTAIVQAAKGLNDALQISGVALVQIAAKYLTPGGPPPYAIGVDLGPVQWDQREGKIHGVFPIRVMLRRQISESDLQDFVEISVAYQCVYNLLREFSEADLLAIPAFLATAGWAHAWPYLRTEVQGISTRLGLPPVTLPLLLPGQAEGVPVASLAELNPDGNAPNGD
jgi:hypothetical protein